MNGQALRDGVITEAGTCREFVTPRLIEAGWGAAPHAIGEQRSFTNVTLQTVARELFKSTEAQFINQRQRPDIVVLPEKTTWQMTGIESFDQVDPTLTRLQHVLVIELKNGGFELTRNEIDQADGYLQDIAKSGAISGSPFICAWLVGRKIAKGVEKEKQLGNPAYVRVRAATFGSLVDTANARLLKLRTVLADRYGGSSTDDLLDRVFSQPTQDGLGI